MSDPEPHLEGVSPEMEHPAGEAPVYGATHDYAKLPTTPLNIEPVISGPDADAAAFVHDDWEPEPEHDLIDDARLAPWALFAAIVALAASMFVGWGIPVAIVAVIAAVMCLRRPIENRGMALWALVLGIAATVFSSVWLIWAAMQLERLG
jgi:hypothetical protein